MGRDRPCGLTMVAGICLLFIVTAAPGEQKDAPAFPVPRAEAEVRSLMPFLAGWGGRSPGDTELFRRWALPYGPLDLQVGNARDMEAEILKNLYLGLAGATFKVDVKGLADSFHCGPACTDYRRGDLKTKLSRIQPLVTGFRALKGIRVLAQWGEPGDYRVNELYRIMGQQNVTSPSPVMGFTPSSTWTPVNDADAYIASLGAQPAEVHRILHEMMELSLAAIVNDPEGVVRVIRVGISDNESGLFFAPGDKAPHAAREGMKDGKMIELIEQIQPHVYFYETT